jgi:hypothetical protein
MWFGQKLSRLGSHGVELKQLLKDETSNSVPVEMTKRKRGLNQGFDKSLNHKSMKRKIASDRSYKTGPEKIQLKQLSHSWCMNSTTRAC